MKKSRFTESQIVAILKEGEAGLPVAQLTHKHGISAATSYCAKSQRTRNMRNFSSLWAPEIATLGLLQTLRLSLGPAR